MKKIIKNNLPWLAFLIFNPITLAIYLALLCSNFIVSCYPGCDHIKVPDPKFEFIQVGKVTSPQNEICNVEEVVRTTYYQANHKEHGAKLDSEHKCWGPSEWERKVLARRIICPSGLNGTSTITNDDSKFHYEVVQ